MGKHLQRKDSGIQFEDNRPSCMWGILHILNSYHWPNVKKLLPHRRHGGGRRHGRCDERTTLLNDDDTGAVQEIRNIEADYFFVDQSTKTSTTNRKSGKARINALIAKEMSKEKDDKCQVKGSHAQSRFQRTDSIHHLELSDYCIPEKNTDWRHQIIFLPSIADASAAKSQHPSLLKAPKKLVPSDDKCNKSETMNGVDYLGQNQNAEEHDLLPEHLDKARETSVNRSEDYVDVLEIFKINKELFSKMLQDSGAGKASRSHSLSKRVRLTKSGSFPVAEKFRGRNFKPGELKHKQNEIWSFPKGERLRANTQASNSIESKSTEDPFAKSIPPMDDDSAGRMLQEESSLGSLEHFNDQKRSQALIDHFKDNNQKLENAIKENKKESTLGGDGRDCPKSGNKNNGSVYDLGKDRLHRVRRTSSLNESLDRYVQLFEGNFRRESKLHLSKSLKLTKETEVSSGGHGPKSFRRILSIPDLESYSSVQKEESHDAFSSGMPMRTVVDSSINVESDGHDEPGPVDLHINIEKTVAPDAVVETESQINMLEGSDSSTRIRCQSGLTMPKNDEGTGIVGEHSEDKVEVMVESYSYSELQINMLEGSNSSPTIERPSGLTAPMNDEGTGIMSEVSEDMLVTMEESCSYREEEIGFTKNNCSELAQQSPVSVPETCFPDDITCPADFHIPEGSELEPQHIHFNESNSCVNLQNRSSKNALHDSENPKNVSTNHFLHIEVERKNDADFSYVRDVLEQSGFIGNEYLGTWHSLDQPLNPSVIEEVESCLPNEPESSGQEAVSSCDHQLLLDLVNEAILEIDERSCTYYPKALSSSCRIRPMPTGYRLLDEVWASISWHLNSRQELDESFNHIIARDLAKGDGWMNLQFETECVGLEVEDIIFNELLDEVICS